MYEKSKTKSTCRVSSSNKFYISGFDMRTATVWHRSGSSIKTVFHFPRYLLINYEARFYRCIPSALIGGQFIAFVYESSISFTELYVCPVMLTAHSSIRFHLKWLLHMHSPFRGDGVRFAGSMWNFPKRNIWWKPLLRCLNRYGQSLKSGRVSHLKLCVTSGFRHYGW